MAEFWKTVLAFICGAGGLAIISIAQERWKWRAERKAVKEDRAENKTNQLGEISKKLDDYIKKQEAYNEKAEKRLEEMEKKDKNQATALKYVLLDRIRYIGQSYIKHGEVTFDERRILREMHDCYHNGLGGNGDADDIMKGVGDLPLKIEGKEEQKATA